MKQQRLWRVCLAVLVCIGLMGIVNGCSKNDNDNNNTPTKPSDVGTTDPEGWTLFLDDSLKNGTSKATQIGGGEFTSEGYHITADNGYIIYDTSLQGNFRVDFYTKGLTPGETYHHPDDQSTILFMQDAPLGTDWTQWRTIENCLFQMIKLTWYPDSSSTDEMKVKGACAGGGGYEVWSYLPGPGGAWVGGPVSWDPDRNYHWVVTVKNGHVECFRDDVFLYYGDGFWPGDPMRFFFGGTNMPFGAVSPDNAIYSDIKIYKEKQ